MIQSAPSKGEKTVDHLLRHLILKASMVIQESQTNRASLPWVSVMAVAVQQLPDVPLSLVRDGG